MEQLKVTRWDDRNYERLKRSSRQLHRRLAKLTRKWDGVLSSQAAILFDMRKAIAQPSEPFMDGEQEWNRKVDLPDTKKIRKQVSCCR